MTDTYCGYAGDRESALIAYLYDDIEPAERDAFEAHLGACTRCRTDLDALGGVRRQLARWSPPEAPRLLPFAAAASLPGGRRVWTTVREMPAWMQAAAALLVLGVSAGAANLNVHYGRTGLSVRTGWSSPPDTDTASVPPQTSPARVDPSSAPWRSELTAFEQRVRSELGATRSAAAVASTPAPADAETMRRVRALIDESERRQERELALRVAEVMRDVNAQRQADLRNIDRSLGLVQSNLGVEVLKQRQSLNYLMRVNQRQ